MYFYNVSKTTSPFIKCEIPYYNRFNVLINTWGQSLSRENSITVVTAIYAALELHLPPSLLKCTLLCNTYIEWQTLNFICLQFLWFFNYALQFFFLFHLHNLFLWFVSVFQKRLKIQTKIVLWPLLYTLCFIQMILTFVQHAGTITIFQLNMLLKENKKVIHKSDFLKQQKNWLSILFT